MSEVSETSILQPQTVLPSTASSPSSSSASSSSIPVIQPATTVQTTTTVADSTVSMAPSLSILAGIKNQSDLLSLLSAATASAASGASDVQNTNVVSTMTTNALLGLPTLPALPKPIITTELLLQLLKMNSNTNNYSGIPGSSNLLQNNDSEPSTSSASLPYYGQADPQYQEQQYQQYQQHQQYQQQQQQLQYPQQQQQAQYQHQQHNPNLMPTSMHGAVALNNPAALRVPMDRMFPVEHLTPHQQMQQMQQPQHMNYHQMPQPAQQQHQVQQQQRRQQLQREVQREHYMTTDNNATAFVQSVAQQAQQILKMEPDSSSNSQPGTPVEQRVVPACAVCLTDSTGIHFGIDACAACSAFFRRTVVLNKNYVCSKGGNCNVTKNGTGGQKCRACRMRKCLTKGMDRSAVQHRRDAIGKYSNGVKRENSTDPECESPRKRSCKNPPLTLEQMDAPSTSSTPNTIVNLSPKFLSDRPSVLFELFERQQFLKQQRQLFYSDDRLADWFTPAPLELQPIKELANFKDCMYHLWKVEPRFAADFINRNRYLQDLPAEDRINMFKKFVVIRQSIEEPYLVYKHDGLKKQWFVFPNNSYIDFTDPDKYFRNGALADLKLDMVTAKNLFLPSFRNAMDTIGEDMARIQITEIEMCALLGLVLFSNQSALEGPTRNYLQTLNNMLIANLHEYYHENDIPDPEIRMAVVFNVMTNVLLHSARTSENMHLLRVFDLIPQDHCFDQMLNCASPLNAYQAQQLSDIRAAQANFVENKNREANEPSTSGPVIQPADDLVEMEQQEQQEGSPLVPRTV